MACCQPAGAGAPVSAPAPVPVNPAPAPTPASSAPPEPAALPSSGATSFDPTPVPVPAGDPRATIGRGVVPARGIVTDPADRALVDRSLAALRTSRTGAPVLAGLERVGVTIKVLDDAGFARAGRSDSAAFYDPASDAMYLRRTWLEQNPAKTASLIAHEGLHALDDKNGTATRAIAARMTMNNGDRALSEWQVQIAKETRGFLVQGRVLQELGQDDPAKMSGAVAVAARGANDKATYDAVFRTIVSSPEGGYNPRGLQLEPFAI